MLLDLQKNVTQDLGKIQENLTQCSTRSMNSLIGCLLHVSLRTKSFAFMEVLVLLLLLLNRLKQCNDHLKLFMKFQLLSNNSLSTFYGQIQQTTTKNLESSQILSEIQMEQVTLLSLVLTELNNF